jgi:hypothetical protein
VDEPSEGILSLYAITYETVSQVLRERDPALAQRAAALADSIFVNTSVAQAATASRDQPGQ